MDRLPLTAAAAPAPQRCARGCRCPRCTAGDTLEQAFRAHERALRRWVRRRVGNEDDAAEIVQEAYLRLMRYGGEPDPGAIRALLYRIAVNLVSMRARNLRRRGGHDVPLDAVSLDSGAPSQEQQLIDRQRLEALVAAINGLPQKCHEVFVLSRFHGLSYPEIARRCGISVKMVEKHVTKALLVCRAKVGDGPA